jgi:hypothetical protein
MEKEMTAREREREREKERKRERVTQLAEARRERCQGSEDQRPVPGWGRGAVPLRKKILVSLAGAARELRLGGKSSSPNCRVDGSGRP